MYKINENIDDSIVDLVKRNFFSPTICEKIENILIIKEDTKLYLYDYVQDFCFYIIDINLSNTELNISVKDDIIFISQFMYQKISKDFLLTNVVCNIFKINEIDNKSKVIELANINKNFEDMNITSKTFNSCDTITKILNDKYIFMYKNYSAFMIEIGTQANTIYYCKRNVMFDVLDSDINNEVNYDYLMGIDTLDIEIDNFEVANDIEILNIKIYPKNINGYLQFIKSHKDNRPPVLHYIEDEKVVF